MTLDLVIRDGTIVDGSGSPPFTADIAVKNGIITEIGKISSRGKRELNAAGAMVTPGFIDMHTHYDAQILWDAKLQGSAGHGVTTAIMGNCGVGCAPLKPEGKEAVISLLSGVEDIPEDILRSSIDWKWETFAEYLEELDQMPRSIDIGTYVCHAPVRMYVMGERATSGSASSLEEQAEMKRIVEEALRGGAVGLSIGRIAGHQMTNGLQTPDYNAPDNEVLTLADAVRNVPGKAIQFASDFHSGSGMAAIERDLNLLEQLSKRSRGAVSMQLHEWPTIDKEDGWRKIAQRVAALNDDGHTIRFEVTSRAIGMMIGLELSFHPFIRHPTYKTIASLERENQLNALRDADFRARILSEQPIMDEHDNGFARMVNVMESESWRIFVPTGAPNYEPRQSESVKSIAEHRGVKPMEVFYDEMLRDDGRQLLYYPFYNFAHGNLNVMHEMLNLQGAMLSFGDAGAHSTQICDSAYSSFSLSFWSRDREGPKLPLERVVHLMSGSQAQHFCLKDRGLLLPGLRADINIIDYNNLHLQEPRLHSDLPMNGKRLLQAAKGYIATIVNGQFVRENDEFTGLLPGRILRGSSL